MTILRITGLLLLLCVSMTNAQTMPGGRALLKPDAATTMQLVGDSAEQSATSRVVDVAGQPFNKALQVEILTPVPKPWSVLLIAPLLEPVRKGDVLLLSLYARTAKSMTGESLVSVHLERNGGDWAKLLEAPVATRGDWTRIDLPGVAAFDLSNDDAQVAIHLGFGQQTVEIAGLSLTNLGPNADVNALPRTRYTYAGREPDAPWRANADARIEQHRKSDLTIRTLDADGKPVAGAKVRARLMRHAFAFGTAVNVDEILGSEPQNAQYRQTLCELFNTAVFENETKWPTLDKPDETQRVMRALDWLDGRGFRTRGHVLVWPNFEWNPDWLRPLAAEPEKLRDAVRNHVTRTAGLFRGRFYEWDVLNEPYTNQEFTQILGNPERAQWFKLARAADPNALLDINDFAILEGNALDREHIDYYEATIRELIDQGAPLDGIGFQGHFGYLLTNPDVVLATLDRFGRFGKPMKITELDINIDDPQLQADYLRDFITVCFSHPQVTGVTQWGFWARRHWRPRAALFDEAFKPRPAAIAFKDLVHRKWTTDVTLTTDAEGVVKVRGFKGDYEITRLDVPSTQREIVVLGDRGADVTLRP